MGLFPDSLREAQLICGGVANIADGSQLLPMIGRGSACLLVRTTVISPRAIHRKAYSVPLDRFHRPNGRECCEERLAA